MARVRDVSIDEVPASVRPVYRRFAAAYGPFLNQVRVFAHRPPALAHLMGLLLDLADEGLLAKRHLEIALVTVSRLNECEYCVAHHAPRLIAEGLDADTTARILEPDCPGLDRVERLVRDYAVQVTLDARRVSDAQFAALREHFSEAQLVELTLRIALCGFFNRFNDAMRIELEDDAAPAPAARDARAGAGT
ncbi:MAG: carboxymuconolactone decarboxylase family protein [Gammaproteobacteria bacterium]|nr:carboxymuconolactone decarboxylase family protein [Gammaproteobacteria bacterium]